MLAIGFAVAVVMAACGDSDSGSNDASVADGSSGDDSGGGSDGGDSSGSDNSAGGSDGGPSSGDDGSGGDEGPDNDAAAAIVGQTTLPEAAADLLDDIDDVVSIGDCESEVVGLAMPEPDGWMCRVLDNPIGGMDGFTLFTSGNQLNITIGTPSDLLSPCEVLQACGDATTVSLSDNFPDTMQFEIAGTVTIWGTYKNSDAELVITSLTALSADDVAFISQVLDSVVEIA